MHQIIISRGYPKKHEKSANDVGESPHCDVINHSRENYYLFIWMLTMFWSLFCFRIVIIGDRGKQKVKITATLAQTWKYLHWKFAIFSFKLISNSFTRSSTSPISKNYKQSFRKISDFFFTLITKNVKIVCDFQLFSSHTRCSSSPQWSAQHEVSSAFISLWSPSHLLCTVAHFPISVKKRHDLRRDGCRVHLNT